MTDQLHIIQTNLAEVRDRIASAAASAGRDPEEIRLVGVSKYVDTEATRDLVTAGCCDLGESRPQSLWSKAEALSDLDIRWHQIGHLQRNKLRRTLPLVSLVHSVDSLRLLRAIDQLQSELDPGSPKPVLLEVNVSGDEAKHGFGPAQMPEAIEAAQQLGHVKLSGLMCMAGLGTTSDQARHDFSKLRELRNDMNGQFPDCDLAELSMGMSSDFESAIAEGATLVRVGSTLFRNLA